MERIMRPAVFTIPVPVVNAICATQSFTATSQTVVINGSLKDPKYYRAFVGAGIQRTINIFCTGNISTSTFTITGFDLRGTALTTSFAGPTGNVTATTPGALATCGTEFYEVSNVTCGTAATTPFTVGTGATGVTNWVQGDVNKNPFAMTVAVITTTYAITVQDTPDNVQSTSSPNVFNHATLVATVSNTESNYAYPARFVRAIFVATTANPIAGGAQVTFIQAG